MDNNFYKIEQSYQNIAVDNKYYKLQTNRLKKNKYVYNSFPLVHKNSVEMNDIRSCIYADAFARYLSFKGNNVLYTSGINNTSKKIYDSVLGNVLSKEDPYTNLKNKSYDDLLQMDIVVEDERKVESHSKKFIKFIQDAFIKLYKDGFIIKSNDDFFLDFTLLKDEVLEELNNKEMFDQLKHSLNYKIGISFSINTTTDTSIDVVIENPECLAGVTFIAIKPTVNARSFYLDTELDYIKEYIKNKKGMGIFSGNFAINPLTNEHIPIIVSHYFDEPFHLGIPDINESDLLFASLFELEYINILSNEKTLLNSRFLDGLPIAEAREKAVNYLVANYDASIQETFNTTLLISTEFTDGISIPFYEDEIINSSDLPVLIDSKNNVRTLNNKLSEKKITNKVFTTNITQAFLSLASRVKYDTSITSYSSSNFLLDLKENLKFDYAIFNSKADYFFTLVVNMITLKNLNCEYKGIIDKFYILPEIDTTKSMLELTAVLSRFGACSLRMNMMSISLLENYYYNVDLVSICYNKINDFIKIYDYEFVQDYTDLDKSYQSLITNATQLIELNDFPMFVELLENFIETVHKHKKITSRQAKGLLILFSLIAPSVCGDIYTKKFKKNFPLMFDSWPV